MHPAVSWAGIVDPIREAVPTGYCHVREIGKLAKRLFQCPVAEVTEAETIPSLSLPITRRGGDRYSESKVWDLRDPAPFPISPTAAPAPP